MGEIANDIETDLVALLGLLWADCFLEEGHHPVDDVPA
jgi:hypothetical protein